MVAELDTTSQKIVGDAPAVVNAPVDDADSCHAGNACEINDAPDDAVK